MTISRHTFHCTCPVILQWKVITVARKFLLRYEALFLLQGLQTAPSTQGNQICFFPHLVPQSPFLRHLLRNHETSFYVERTAQLCHGSWHWGSFCQFPTATSTAFRNSTFCGAKENTLRAELPHRVQPQGNSCTWCVIPSPQGSWAERSTVSGAFPHSSPVILQILSFFISSRT